MTIYPRRRRADPLELLVALTAGITVLLLLNPHAGHTGRGHANDQGVTHPVASHSPPRTHPGLSGLGVVIQPFAEAGAEAGGIAAH